MLSWWQYKNLKVSNNSRGLRGVFALSKFKAGFIILKEVPVIGSTDLELAEKISDNNNWRDLYPMVGGSSSHNISEWPEVSIVNYNNWNVEKGHAIFLHISLINHSCIPNTILITNESESILYALRDIDENEELTISYLDPIGVPKALLEREEDLKNWMDVCLCDYCISGDKNYYKLISDNNEVAKYIPGYKHYKSYDDILCDIEDENCRCDVCVSGYDVLNIAKYYFLYIISAFCILRLCFSILRLW